MFDSGLKKLTFCAVLFAEKTREVKPGIAISFYPSLCSVMAVHLAMIPHHYPALDLADVLFLDCDSISKAKESNIARVQK